MTYSVREIYYTLQGEGAQTGRPAVFLRFAGCNLWSGREQDRERSICRFCDTEVVGTGGPGGGKFETAEALAAAAKDHWPAGAASPYVVCTGGEPLLQLDRAAIDALHAEGIEVGVETNGTIRAHHEVSFSARVGGRIIGISPSFEDGAFFEEGEVLLELDPVDLKAAVASAEASHRRAHATFLLEEARAKQAKENWKILGYEEEPSKLVLREPQLAEAKASLDAAQAQLDRARRDLDRT